jgi:hypothetical protein
MNALLNHKWGVSRTQDAIWARVAGMSPSRAVRKPIMVLNLKAHMDESYSDLEFVIGGYIAPAETWAKFVSEWEKLLPLATRDRQNVLRFHMTDMNTPDRMPHVRLFYRVIEDHGLIPIAARMDMEALRRAKERVRSFCLQVDPAWEPKNFGPFDRPYLFLFRALMDAFHRGRANLSAIPQNERVDFIFDKGTGQEKFIQSNWSAFIENQPEEVRELYGKTPDFADDVEVPALQAADLWAWWVRKWYEEDAPDPPDLPDRLRRLKFDGWQGKPGTPIVMVPVTEDYIFDILRGACLSTLLEEWRELGSL